MWGSWSRKLVKREMGMPKSHVGTGIWTPANIVTLVRVLLVPVWLFFAEKAVVDTGAFSLSALLVCLGYVAISLTDKLDGYLARSRGEVTAFGQFLDPIADKLAVVVALSYLLETGMTNSWVLLVVVAREFLVSGLRMVVASAGVVVPASNLGKWKTAVTMVSICGLLFCMALPSGQTSSVLTTVFNVGIAISVVLTIWSGADYFVKCWPYVAREAR